MYIHRDLTGQDEGHVLRKVDIFSLEEHFNQTQMLQIFLVLNNGVFPYCLKSGQDSKFDDG